MPFPIQTKAAWKVSLHGGHCGTYCDHATGSLREVIEAAIAYGYSTFGVSEHAPRVEDRFLYDDERTLGWNIDTLHRNFEAYVEELAEVSEEYGDRLVVLRGFETEVVPTDSYVELMLELREKYRFEYMLGSVHHVREIIIDGPPKLFNQAMEAAGGVERLAIEYYVSIAEMVKALQPDVVGHLDLIRRNVPDPVAVETPAVREAALHALEIIRDHNCILDLNTAGIRKGLGCPYPRPWLIREAHRRGVPFCFGDDSHGPQYVGQDVDAARQYLIDNGVHSITILTRVNGQVVRERVSLTG